MKVKQRINLGFNRYCSSLQKIKKYSYEWVISKSVQLKYSAISWNVYIHHIHAIIHVRDVWTKSKVLWSSKCYLPLDQSTKRRLISLSIYILHSEFSCFFEDYKLYVHIYKIIFIINLLNDPSIFPFTFSLYVIVGYYILWIDILLEFQNNLNGK